MTGDWIVESVEQYFSASPIGPFLEVSRVFHDESHSVSQALKTTFERVPEELLSLTKKDANFLALYGHLDHAEQDWFAREQTVVNELNLRNRLCRRHHLLTQNNKARPAPYDEPALADVPVSEDRLVPLSEFEVKEGVLVRNKRANVILPPTPSENSSHWITRALFEGHSVFWLHTYHPNNYGAFNKQRNFNKETQIADGLESYVLTIQKFVNTRILHRDHT